MGEKKFKTELRYRGSRDGWKSADFHRMSDGLGPTVTLMKIKDNEQCIGGFTSAKWASPKDITPIIDSTAMLFNLTTKKLFKCKYEGYAIMCKKKNGPTFGNGEL
jgi:hypothetical protein